MGCWLQITPREYLETALMPVAGSGAAVGAKNLVRGADWLHLLRGQTRGCACC